MCGLVHNLRAVARAGDAEARQNGKQSNALDNCGTLMQTCFRASLTAVGGLLGTSWVEHMQLCSGVYCGDCQCAVHIALSAQGSEATALAAQRPGASLNIGSSHVLHHALSTKADAGGALKELI